MNTQLVDYGIETEHSDMRAHVCVNARRVYVYPTQCGIDAIHKGDYPLKPAYQGKIKTAEGYLVPPRDIAKIREVVVPQLILLRAGFSETQDEARKGESAVYVVKWLLQTARFPMFCDPAIVKEMDLQIKGVDLYVNLTTRIQVKCDYKGGPKAYGGTGNLYLQVRECNPFGKH